MADSGLGRLLKATIEVTTKGTSAARDALRGVGDELDKLGSKSIPVGDTTAQAKAFKAFAANAQGAGAAFKLTRQEALTLNYTIGDLVASLASGASPFTILLQQGGQVRDGFGSFSNLLGKISIQLIRFAPQVAAVAAAVGAFYGLKIGNEAAKALAQLGDQADKAKLSVGSLQKLLATGAATGVPQEEVATGLKRISDEALKANIAQRDLNNKITEASRRAAFGVAGAREELARLNAEKPDNIFAKLGVSLYGFTGRIGDSLPAIKQLADKLVALPKGLRRDELINLAESTFGEGLTKILLKGSKGIEDYAQKLDALVPPFTKAQVEAAKAQQEISGLYAEAQSRAATQTGALFIPAALEATKFLLDNFRNARPLIADFANQLTEFLRVLNGDTQAQQRNPVLTEFVGVLGQIKSILGDVASVVSTAFGGLKDGFSEVYRYTDDLVKKFNEAFGTNFTTNTTLAIGALGLLAAAFGPVGVAIGLVSGALVLLKQNWDALKSATYGFGSGIDASGGSGNSGFASGGFVSGPGTGTSDSIPAWLSNGEFVVRAAAVRAPGVLDLLHRINGMRFSAPSLLGRTRFADGGLVGLPSGLAGAAGGRPLTLVLDGKTFGGLTGQADTISALEKYATLRQLSATSKRAPSRIG